MTAGATMEAPAPNQFAARAPLLRSPRARGAGQGEAGSQDIEYFHSLEANGTVKAGTFRRYLLLQ
ncbi:hypothetical protein GCM10011348_43400 [Marinobacterium nitratireducens]|uniref:Uncharacterized protein n=1 Tax=Marinobacterium nitratireducens TaxID=518897 RepID=A0A918DY51_9GAMM|nr:hypothetical protein GCM10011348_43400 [Marinobacterium nitratireducens]